MRCGGPATRLRTHRSIRHPFRYSLLGALGWPASWGGLATLFCCAALTSGLGLIGRYGRLAGYGLVLCWFLQIVRESASGGDRVPGPNEFTGLIEGIVSPALRAALASVWVLGPFAIWFVFAGYTLDALAQHPVHLDAAAIGLACAGLLIAPLAMVLAALDSPLQLIVNPFAMISLTFALGVDYWLATLSCALCAAGTFLIQIARSSAITRSRSTVSSRRSFSSTCRWSLFARLGYWCAREGTRWATAAPSSTESRSSTRCRSTR